MIELGSVTQDEHRCEPPGVCASILISHNVRLASIVQTQSNAMLEGDFDGCELGVAPRSFAKIEW